MNRRHGHPLLRLGFCCLLVVWLVPGIAGGAEPRALTPEQQAVVAVARARALPGWVNAADRKQADRVVDLIRKGKTEAAKAEWRNLVQSKARTHDVEQLRSLGSWIVRQALLVSRPALDQQALKLAQSRDLHAALGGYVAGLKSSLRKFPSAPGATVAVRVKAVEKGQLVDRGTKPMTRSQLEAGIRSLDSEYQTMSDMSQQLQLQLQDAMNKQQQVMQTLSNLLKNMHDTAKAIIQNLKA